MKAGCLLMLSLSLTASRVLAQQPALETSRPPIDSAPLRYDPKLSSLLTQDAQPTQSEAVLSKHLKVSGPLIHPFKAKKILDVPRRLLHLVNPFARLEPKEEFERVGGLSPRAWTTTVGWSTGPSCSPIEVTHEPTINLISFSPASRP